LNIYFSTEAKNTERLLEMRQSLNTLNEQKLELEIELQKVTSKNSQLLETAKKYEKLLNEIENLHQGTTASSARIQSLNLDLQREKQRGIESEKRAAILESRLRVQAEQDAIATEITDNDAVFLRGRETLWKIFRVQKFKFRVIDS